MSSDWWAGIASGIILCTLARAMGDEFRARYQIVKRQTQPLEDE